MSDKLYYFSGSADKLPGKGANEYVSDVTKYSSLASVKDWRRKLSNFHIAPFECYGRRWNTVEHMFQAAKVALVDKKLAHTFCLDSGTELSQGYGSEAQKRRKIVLLNDSQLSEWEDIKRSVMYDALYAKFSQNEDMKCILLCTADAELWHGTPRHKPSRQYSLELVREQLVD